MNTIRTAGPGPGYHGNGDVDKTFTTEAFVERVRGCTPPYLYYPGESPRDDVDHTLFTSGPAAKKVTQHAAGKVNVRAAKRGKKRE